jgi:hypothetical protein
MPAILTKNSANSASWALSGAKEGRLLRRVDSLDEGGVIGLAGDSVDVSIFFEHTQGLFARMS